MNNSTSSSSSFPNDVLARFWAKVEIPDLYSCWEWTGAVVPKGYGKIHCCGKFLYAHRVSWQIVNGEIPDGLLVCHHCDNPGCVNPSHLFLGDYVTNARDMVKKGRAPHGSGPGEAAWKAKLTNEQVSEIRSACGAGETQVSVSKRYGVDKTTVSAIVRRKTWKHVP